MDDDSNLGRLPDLSRDAPATEPREDPASQPAPPFHAIDDPEIDIVDFQSMQSFPASDSPAWPSPYSEIAETPATEQDSNERRIAQHPASGTGRHGWTKRVRRDRNGVR